MTSVLMSRSSNIKGALTQRKGHMKTQPEKAAPCKSRQRPWKIPAKPADPLVLYLKPP